MAALGVLVSSARAFELPLTVEEPAGIARTAEPVSGGVPLIAGQFKKGQAFALFDAAGKEVPVQVLPLVVDEQGFLRWVLLDFQTDLGPKEKKVFTLRDGAPRAMPAKAVKVSREGGRVIVDTGAVSLTFDPSRPLGLFSSVTAGGKQVVDGATARYGEVCTDGTFEADKPASIEVAYEGPMRATVTVKGPFKGDDKSKFQYIAHVTAWAGKSEVLVKYNLSNSNPDHYCWRIVRDSSLILTLPGGAGEVVAGADKPTAATGAVRLAQGLLADQPGSGVLTADGAEVWKSAGKNSVADGWLRAGGVQVTDILFTADPARALAVDGRTLTLTGVIERFEGVKDARGRERGTPYRAKARALPDSSHHSSRYLMDFAASADAAACAQQAERARNRLWLMAPPNWYFDTESLSVGRFGTQADERRANDTWGLKYEGTGPGAPGVTYGRFIRGEDNHFETEEDIVEVLLLMWLRTGSRPFFDNCQAWAEYNVDMQIWRTDGWRWKDGGGWWRNGPFGNRPQRAADPVTGMGNMLRVKAAGPAFASGAGADLSFLTLAKSCHCHNWGEGVAGWFCLTGDREAYDATLDVVEYNIDYHRRAKRGGPGDIDAFSRDFTRASYLTHAARMVMPENEFVREASDWYAKVYFERPTKEPRGIVNGLKTVSMKSRAPLRDFVGDPGMAAMKEAGVTENPENGLLTDPKGHTWCPLNGVNSWMFPPLSHAMDCYWRLTGNEDAQDFAIAYGQAAARVFYQRHGNQHKQILVDFPARGIAKDFASWTTEPDNRWAEGVPLSGYLSRFHPDVCARAYSLCGEPLLKQRAYDYWFAGSHRGHNATKMKALDRIGMWSNYYGPHSEEVTFNGRMFYIWAYPRADQVAPEAVKDLQVTVRGGQATVTFTAPADQGGGKVARYQVKCSDKTILDYEAFLEKFNAYEDAAVTNWWMATNLTGEPTPGGAGQKVTFQVTGVPQDAGYFAVRSFDDSSNRSAISNLAQAAK